MKPATASKAFDGLNPADIAFTSLVSSLRAAPPGRLISGVHDDGSRDLSILVGRELAWPRMHQSKSGGGHSAVL